MTTENEKMSLASWTTPPEDVSAALYGQRVVAAPQQSQPPQIVSRIAISNFQPGREDIRAALHGGQ